MSAHIFHELHKSEVQMQHLLAVQQGAAGIVRYNPGCRCERSSGDAVPGACAVYLQPRPQRLARVSGLSAIRLVRRGNFVDSSATQHKCEAADIAVALLDFSACRAAAAFNE
jgi:hypothetical protein